MIKVTPKQRPNTEFSPLIQDDKIARRGSRDRKTAVHQTVESAELNIPRAARVPQKIAQQLARKGDELHAEKVRQIKKSIAKGEYEVDPREIAKSIIRAEISGHFKKGKIQSMSVVLKALLARTEEQFTAEGKMAAHPGESQEAHRNVGCRCAVQANRCRTKPCLFDFLC